MVGTQALERLKLVDEQLVVIPTHEEEENECEHHNDDPQEVDPNTSIA